MVMFSTLRTLASHHIKTGVQSNRMQSFTQWMWGHSFAGQVATKKERWDGLRCLMRNLALRSLIL